MELSQLKKLRALDEKHAQKQEDFYLQVDRFLEQEFVVINSRVVRENCELYNPTSNLNCRICRFYSSTPQKVKLDKICPAWPKVFGDSLRKVIVNMLYDNIKVDLRFIRLWFKRREGVPRYVEFSPVKKRVLPERYNIVGEGVEMDTDL